MSDNILDGMAQDLGEQREMGFKMIKANMMAQYQKKYAHVNPLTKGAILKACQETLDDCWKVFSQIVEADDSDEMIR